MTSTETIAHGDFSATVVGNSRGRGRPRKAASLDAIAARIGVPRSTFSRARRHVEAIEEFPQLAALPQGTALRRAALLRGEPPRAARVPLLYSVDTCGAPPAKGEHSTRPVEFEPQPAYARRHLNTKDPLPRELGGQGERVLCHWT